jgi:hypothetical protein
VGLASWAAFNSTAYNRLLHDDEKSWIQENAKRVAGQENISEEEAAKRLEAAACTKIHCQAEFSPASTESYRYGRQEIFGSNDAPALAAVEAEMARNPAFLEYSSWDGQSDSAKRLSGIMWETMGEAGIGFAKGFSGFGTPSNSMQQAGYEQGEVASYASFLFVPPGFGLVGRAGSVGKAVQSTQKEILLLPFLERQKALRPAMPQHGVIYVTEGGVALPPRVSIPNGYVGNPNRAGSYGEIVNGKFQERIRIDPATSPGQKGPNYSHYHLNGKGTHYSSRPGDKNPGW